MAVRLNQNDLVIVMGVSGCGKSTTAAHLSRQTGWTMIEGDHLHTQANKSKMEAGIPLTHSDRLPWLDAIVATVNADKNGPLILACSALNKAIRDYLAERVERACCWILLELPEQQLLQRLEQRQDHFMPSSLLQSQLEALDPPLDAIRLDGTLPTPQLSAALLTALNERIDQ
ncbi:MAG: gluconokinase, GntK/IdnK-type [Parasphingorhabdus sp.]|uniref:gluconokinase n=1 Tax=Parasphingorhabdus sp. TaxID=2709688 RepID=UPI00329848F3